MLESLEAVFGQPDRQQSDLASIQAVAVSGYGSDATRTRQRSRSPGFDGHLVKPVGVERLEALLRSI